MEAYGPEAYEILDAREWAGGPARRRVPPYVGMSQRFSPISGPGLYRWFSHTLPKELQWHLKMQLSSDLSSPI